jgi:hypothetical protein
VLCTEAPTTAEEDLAMLESDAAKSDPRLEAVLHYRIERKTLLRTAQALLQSYIRSLT